MATITKNIDTILSKAVNGPKVDGIPLYTRIDGGQDGFSSQATKSVKWEQASQHTYSSPTNIKRLFITGKRVVIETFKPIISNNKPDGRGCWREIALKEDNLYDIATQAVKSIQGLSTDRITLKGTGLGVLSSPWVLSNIEEVYFDWTILASDINRNKIQDCNALLGAYVTGKRGLIKSQVPLDILVESNSCNIKNMRSRFPRLKCVAMISELDSILSVRSYKGNQNIDSLEASAKIWLELDTNIKLVKMSNSLMVICKTNKDIPYYNTNFSLRDGLYKYDKDVLRPFFDSYTQRVKNKYREDNKKTEKQVEVQSTEDIRTEKSELEQLLDSMESNSSKADIKSVLLISLAGCKNSEVEEIFSEMTPEGEKKYREMLK